ncbi:MAG: hypothetical protein PSV36_05915 [Algoriphagus sp.]|nr:hypothetical protein [Algoriphagus sp.]
MLSPRLLKRIDNSFIGRIVSDKRDIIERTNPDKIYIENVRSFFNTSFGIAKFLCEKAVDFGYFEKYYGYKCPIHGNVIYSSKTELEGDQEVYCGTCEDLGKEKFRYFANELNTVVFYRLIKNKEKYAVG